MMVHKDNHFLSHQLEKKLPFEALYRINAGQNLEEEVSPTNRDRKSVV